MDAMVHLVPAAEAIGLRKLCAGRRRRGCSQDDSRSYVFIGAVILVAHF
jgi:hypothetical protein